MKKLSMSAAYLMILVATQFALAQKSTPEQQRVNFINNTKLLERKPFDPNASVAREWGFKWVIETDQVTIGLCGTVMALNPEKKNKFKSELLMQMSFGMAVFKLENDDKKDDEKAAQLAGVESMLRTYEVMVTENEKARNAELDALIAKQKSGELKAVVDAAYDKGSCDKKAGK